MRARLYDIPFLLLLGLPLYVSVYGYGVISTILALVLWFVVREAIVFYAVKSRQTDDRILLETHPLSHFAEKVRWSLDKLGVSYEEQPDVGCMILMLTGRLVPVLHIPGKNISIENSADILRYLYGQHCKDEERSAFLKPTAEAVALEQKIDKMGENICRYLYYHAVVLPDGGDDNALTMWGLKHDSVPGWQKIMLKAIFPLAKMFLIHRLELTPEGAAEALKQCKEFFKETDSLLSDGRKFLLGTDEPTYVDIALAALGGVLASPDNYGGRTAVNDESRLRASAVSPAMQREVKEFRSTPTGKHILKMYEKHR